MTDDRKKSTVDARTLPRIDEDLSRTEIMDVLADEGYPAAGRKGWLKSVLTRLAKEEQESPNKKRAELVAEIKDVLDENVSGDPKANDTL
ncbi:hypothetical protein U5922_018140 [Aquicoccus sp. G2-2]|jgi:hypothetical protein|uniref:hypothetical protein n=1 Tax=Aquicoccus sp. G2-2 TaxID=3092120 RepID=UPI002AE0A13F|nr:hypothetical protein [Aquicoccus sp. G2-2]MEA1115293.1 hypothetical protein [Aquicoccus sp. G2-2]